MHKPLCTYTIFTMAHTRCSTPSSLLLSRLALHLPILTCSPSILSFPSPPPQKIHQTPVMLERQPAAELHKSNAQKKNFPLSLQSGRTASSTEVNYRRPSILHTLKLSAGTGRKASSVCYTHHSSLQLLASCFSPPARHAFTSGRLQI